MNASERLVKALVAAGVDPEAVSVNAVENPTLADVVLHREDVALPDAPALSAALAAVDQARAVDESKAAEERSRTTVDRIIADPAELQKLADALGVTIRRG